MTKSKKRHGRAASAPEKAQMKALGYDTPAAAAKKYGVAPTTVYGWAESWTKENKSIGDKLAVVHTTRGLWVLLAAVAEKRPNLKALTRKSAA